jgi:hypothetical protein
VIAPNPAILAAISCNACTLCKSDIAAPPPVSSEEDELPKILCVELAVNPLPLAVLLPLVPAGRQLDCGLIGVIIDPDVPPFPFQAVVAVL